MCVCMEQNFIYRDKIWCSGWKKDSERKTVKERQLKRDLRFLRQLNRYLVWFRLISLNKDNFKYILLWNKKNPKPSKKLFLFFQNKKGKKRVFFLFFSFSQPHHPLVGGKGIEWLLVMRNSLGTSPDIFQTKESPWKFIIPVMLYMLYILILIWLVVASNIINLFDNIN